MCLYDHIKPTNENNGNALREVVEVSLKQQMDDQNANCFQHNKQNQLKYFSLCHFIPQFTFSISRFNQSASVSKELN